MKVVIIGCGRVGSRLARQLEDEGHEVTLVDRDPGAFDRSSGRGVFEADTKVEFVVGDGTDAELLRRCGVETADALVAVTEGDNRNIMAAQIAQHVFKVPHVVCRIYDPIREDAYRKIGLNSFCPTIEGAKQARQMLLAGC
ncbi:MAG: TrkA family potassium uptake protein [Candidatus Dormibacteraeota bacterium]|nr:TrkA family potassium uptake protein [Candidatus Dormibacteraeota bacterium]